MKTDPHDPVSSDLTIVENYRKACGGLTKREYFAAMALQGICANSGNVDPSLFEKMQAHKIGIEEVNAASAVMLADALIAELNKEKES